LACPALFVEPVRRQFLCCMGAEVGGRVDGRVAVGVGDRVALEVGGRVWSSCGRVAVESTVEVGGRAGEAPRSGS
jgi:hypothetical protein